jgi:hypothetical protein
MDIIVFKSSIFAQNTELMKSLSAILSFCCLITTAALGQSVDAKVIEGDTSQTHELRTLRGDVLYGTLLRRSNDTLFFQIRADLVLRYPAAAVQSVTVFESAPAPAPAPAPVDTEMVLPAAKPVPDPGRENLLFSPTAFGMRKNKGEYHNLNVLWNQVELGITDHFSLGAGVLLPVIFSLHTKLVTPVSPSTHIGGGANVFLILPEMRSSAYHLYGVLSKGTPDNYLNLTFGVASTFEGTLQPTFSGGGAWRFSSNWRVMADIVWLAHSDGGLLVPSFSASWFDAKNRVDFGFMAFSPFPLPLPYARYARRF